MIPSPSGVTGRGRGQSAPLETSDREIFADVSGIRKKEARKKGKRGENWEEKKENCEREGGKLELEVGKVIKRGEDLFFFFPCFWLLKTTEICFGSTKIGIFYREKSISRQKKIGKNYFAPLSKIYLLRPCPLPQLLPVELLMQTKALHNRTVCAIHASVPRFPGMCGLYRTIKGSTKAKNGSTMPVKYFIEPKRVLSP